MAQPTPTTVRVRITVTDLPGDCQPDGRPVLVGVQRGKLTEQAVRATAVDATFGIEFGVVDADGGRDFRGPYVHGRKGDRFLYLVWCQPLAGDDTEMFARTKFTFDDLPEGLLDEVVGTSSPTLQCSFAAMGAGKGPFGTVHPPRVAWTAG